MKKFKKLISLLTAAVMAVSVNVNAAAEALPFSGSEASSCDYGGIISALQAVESEKDNFNLSDVDFQKLTVSDPIKAYEYTNGGVSFIYNFIPLLYNGTLTAWAVEAEDESGTYYQIATAYIDEVNAIADNLTPFALIYDKTCCYLYDGLNLHKLGSFDSVEGRSDLSEYTSSFSSVSLSCLNKTETLGYMPEVVAYGATLPVTIYECPVKYVTQYMGGYLNLCWAASIASIVNYKNNTSYNALQIAQQNRSNEELNKDDHLPYGMEANFLKKYGLQYQYINSVPSLSDISYNLEMDYPIFAAFENSGRGHATVMYKCAINNQSINESLMYIKDPDYGTATVRYSSGTYKYINPNFACELTLKYTTRRY
ncbi:MAG: hypothetical protein NC203_07135 [Firmicutes bacterium]|nr:hypothetical protein [[Eubacterium] siraeum]MCM1488123.1 hypothetical protein [Bacillota bacterium]